MAKKSYPELIRRKWYDSLVHRGGDRVVGGGVPDDPGRSTDLLWHGDLDGPDPAGGVPALLPDETLHSLVARFARTRCVGRADVGRTVFEDPWTVAALELPHRLDPLCRWLRPPWTPSLVADRLTSLPYYSGFHAATERDAVVGAMRGDGAPVRSRLGAASWWLRRGGRVRYCPTCREGMLNAHGEAYWRRAHQLPGVLVCPEHGDWLAPAAWPRVGRHVFVAATAATCPAVAASAPPRGVLAARLLDAARSSATLLRHDCAWDGAPTAYAARLAEVGLRWSPEKVDMGRLARAVAAFHGEALDLLGPSVGFDLSDGSWAVPMLTGRRRVHHPLLHVLLGVFLRSGGAEARRSVPARGVARTRSGATARPPSRP